MSKTDRKQFREQVLDRDGNECIVPWCERPADDVHHVLERSLWGDGGYIMNNGVSVCNHHHQHAEDNNIPPQAFWQWMAVNDPPLPDSVQSWQVDKWGQAFETPPWEDLREEIKYPSTRHLLPLYWHDDDSVAESRVENDDTGLKSLEEFIGVPLVITHKIDGGNCMLVNDVDNPVRARNGSRPKETMERLYESGGLYWRQAVNEKLPDRLQVFGEWVWAKHSIHYGCDCEEPCDDVGPALSELVGVEDDRAYFQVFGVFDTKMNVWLSWPETEKVADVLGFPTVPVIYSEGDRDQATFETTHEARQELMEYARRVIGDGGEGIVVRKKFPFHYGQFKRSVGKYVREGHVASDERHWSKRTTKRNVI